MVDTVRSHANSPTLHDPTPDPVGGPPAPKQSPGARENESQNTVLRFDGQAPRQAPDGAAPRGEPAGVSAASLQASGGALSTEAVLEQVGQHLGAWERLVGASEGDVRDIVGLLSSLPKQQFTEVFSTLRANGRLDTLMGNLSPETRSMFLEAALKMGVLSETPGKVATPRPLNPPAQPGLLNNDASLPDSVRKAIHQENSARAQHYTKQFDAYVEAYCEAAKHAPSPMDLRGLGALSTPPALREPGVTQKDLQLFKTYDLTQVNRGVERAAVAVSDRISDFRGEAYAGSYSLDAELFARASGAGAVVGGSAKTQLGTFGQKNELVGRAGVGGGGFTSGAHAHDVGGVEYTKDTAGEAGAALIVGHQVAQVVGLHEAALEQEGSKTIVSAGLTPVGAYAAADPEKGVSGAGLEVSKTVGFAGLRAQVGARVGVSAYGVAKEYYPDIGGKQEGVFGPMPELEAKTPWAALSKERQAWYSRQGFPENQYPYQ